MDETTSLRKRLESLSQELYDIIYDLTFLAPPEVVHVDNGYRPPHVLHVDKKSRKDFASSYYRNTTFLFADEEVFNKWIAPLKYLPANAFGTKYLAINLPGSLRDRLATYSRIRKRFQKFGSELHIISSGDAKALELFIKAESSSGNL
ncbi:hypothetical protein CKM354_000499500 [Cercospora kikuchii]|uniref:Uncharacterized protein n=1 Tax=Cercospora kikuchii TaxID=84275 RepID=A0A9P3FGB7_9PEZI|nr:uncharacterized protein CKM354_000499500 [Cercospora kikuchii]GIZ41699.1 hypothetical protein CKM354_000499500 [Cercospora kikuchii]